MGGQAVLEGVLMRTKHGYSVAVRRASRAVVIRSVPFRPIAAKYPIFKTPFLRGAVSLFEMLALGMKALQFSAEEMDKDLREQERLEKAAKEAKAGGGTGEGVTGSTAIPATRLTGAATAQAASTAASAAMMADAETSAPLPEDAASVWSNWAMAGMMAFSLVVAVGMMVLLPNLLAEGAGWLAKWTTGNSAEGNPFAEDKRPLLYNLISGGFRATILLGYIWVISRLPDIRRVFEYHGAEHKAVFAFETGGPLTVGRAQEFTTLHPRCGTSFLVVVVAVSIVVFAFVAWALAAIWPGFLALPFLAKKGLILLGHVVALPLVAGTSYEFLKLSARMSDKGGAWKCLIWPGLQTQRLTTRPPADDQVEVALIALKAALAIGPEEKEQRVEVLQPGEEFGGAVGGGA